MKEFKMSEIFLFVRREKERICILFQKLVIARINHEFQKRKPVVVLQVSSINCFMGINSGEPNTVKPRFTGPRFTGDTDLRV